MTELVAAGIPPNALSDWTGHSPEVSMAYYQRVPDELWAPLEQVPEAQPE